MRRLLFLVAVLLLLVGIRFPAAAAAPAMTVYVPAVRTSGNVANSLVSTGGTVTWSGVLSSDAPQGVLASGATGGATVVWAVSNSNTDHAGGVQFCRPGAETRLWDAGDESLYIAIDSSGQVVVHRQAASVYSANVSLDLVWVGS